MQCTPVHIASHTHTLLSTHIVALSSLIVTLSTLWVPTGTYIFTLHTHCHTWHGTQHAHCHTWYSCLTWHKCLQSDVDCFLFTDLILVCKAPKRMDKFKIIRPPMRLDQLVVSELKDKGGWPHPPAPPPPPNCFSPFPSPLLHPTRFEPSCLHISDILFNQLPIKALQQITVVFVTCFYAAGEIGMSLVHHKTQQT